MLRRNEKHFREVFNSLAGGVAILTLQSRFLEANPAFCSLIGYSEVELRALDAQKLTHPHDWQGLKDKIEQLVSGQILTVVMETRYLGKDGQTIWVHNHVSLPRGLESQPAYLIMECEDITERKLAVSALREGQLELTKELANLEQIQNLSFQVFRGDRVERLYDQILKVGMAVLRSDMATMHVLCSERGIRGEFLLVGSQGLDAPTVEEFKGVHIDSIYPDGESFRAGGRMMVEDIESCEFLNPSRLKVLRKFGIRAVQSSPMLARSGRIMGILSTYWRQPYRPSDRELALCDVLMGQTADLLERTQAEAALRESEERFSRFMQHLPGLAWIKDLEGRYVYVNDAAALVFQTPRERLYGSTDDQIFHPEVAAQFKENDQRALASGTGVQVIETLRHKDGMLHHSLVSKFPIPGMDGQPIFIGGMAIDITDYKRVEDALRDREERYELILAGAEAAIWDWDIPAKRVHFSPRWKELRGLSDDEVSDREEEWSSRIHPDDLERVMASVQAHFDGRTAVFHEEYRVRHKDGHWIWIADRGIAKRNEAGTTIRMAGSETDITERKKAEEHLRRLKDQLQVKVKARTRKLLASQERLRALTLQLSLTEERERRKLASDVHDYLGQLLFVGGMKLEQAKKMLSPSPAADRLMQDVMDILEQALTYSRNTIAELRPPALPEAGLESVCRWLAEGMRKHGLRVKVHGSHEKIQLPEDHTVLLFQSVRELLFNVLKHAGVKQATVRMSIQENGEACISVEDRGKGLDVNAMQRAQKPGHLGLFGVQERMRAMGGRVKLTSTPGQGTIVRLLLPVGTKSVARVERKSSSPSN